MKGKKAVNEMQDANQQLFFTVCPRCNYPYKDAHQAAAGRAGGKIGGKAKVKKGFAVIGQPNTEARKLGWVKRKEKAEAKARAKAEAQKAQE